MTGGLWYRFLYCVAIVALRIYHPVLYVKGRENIPQGSRCVICANHSGYTDPVWIVMAMKQGYIPRIMAKKEALRIPVLGWIMKRIGVIGVDRGNADVNAIKEGLRCLKQDQQLLIFPEGTRKKPGKVVTAKRGAIMLANRTDSPILPVYLTVKRRPFSPMTCIFGTPYRPNFGTGRPTEEQMETAARQLMDEIYQMGEQV